MVDIPGNSTTTSTVSVGSTVNGLIEVGGDHDWFRIDLTAGQIIRVALNGSGTSPLEDPYVRIRDASGVVIFENDDGGGAFNALANFAATYTGTYYIDVAAWDSEPAEFNYIGGYELKVSNYEAPVVATIAQIADQLTDGFWGGESHHFVVAQGGSISVNLTALTSVGQTLAREALRQWTDIIGVSFSEVNVAGQITFDDNEEGAHSSSVYSEGIITSSTVNVSTDWLVDSGTTFNTYSFQTYVHEIGHALGLGHAGNYDGNASFPLEALFLNDAWSTSVMSYFAPTENSYFAQLGFTDSSIGTPMLADIFAMSQLYGLSTTTRAGNTTYGFNSNAGNIAYNASLHPTVAYTVFDSGGIDTLDYSGFGDGQTIDLTSGAFSNIGGRNGAVAIALGTVIENAIGGTGNDTLVGNAENNLLNGGAGNDTVSYAAATAGVTVSLGIAGAQNTIGAGTDTLIGFEVLTGSQYGDRLSGGLGNLTVYAGGGDDILVPSTDGDILSGEAGNDTFISGAGNDVFSGGDGFDTVDYSAVNAAVGVGSGADGIDSLFAIERIIGSNYDDRLANASVLIGGSGNDTLTNFSTSAAGGTGNDIYEPWSDTQVIEVAGEGTDLVRTHRNFILPANVENLTLLTTSSLGGLYDPNPVSGTGNTLSNVITGNDYANQLSGLAGADTLSGGAGNDIMTGGAGTDTFRDSVEALNGDTIVDFSRGDRLHLTNASLNGFSFSLSGSTLTYTGGSLTLTGVTGALVVSAAAGGGVQLNLQGPANDPSNDFNGDGRSDILWRNVGSGDVVDWLGQPNGSFAGNGSSYNNAGLAWNVTGTGDFNGDGRDDILWRHANSGEIVNWLGQANGSFTGNAASFNNASKAWDIVGTGDFNGDHRDDLLWRNHDGTITSWLGQSDGSFAGNANIYNAAAAWQVAGTGDFNGDGLDDVLWRNLTSGEVVNWLGQANGSFAGNAAAFNNANLSWHLVGTGDFNGDERDDVLWRNDDGTITNWLGQANGSFAGNPNAENDVSSNWHIVGIGDYDGNGRDDVLWRSDGGLVTNWLGQANGSLVGNPNALSDVNSDWQIQPSDWF